MAYKHSRLNRIIIIVLVLLLYSKLLPSALAESTEIDLSPTTPLSITNKHSYYSSWGIFDPKAQTVSNLFENTSIKEYLSLFENIAAEKEVVVLKNGLPQTSGYLEEGMVVRCYRNAESYLDYTITELKSLPEKPSLLEIAKNVSDNNRATSNLYGFVLPLDDMGFTDEYISDYFGYRNDPFTGEPDNHNGIDISWAGIAGTPIKAVYAGTATVTQASEDETGYGCHVVINHGLVNGEYLKTVYAHMDSAVVTDGQAVNKGQIIGYVGTTGYSTGYHLHFEVRVGSASSMWACTPVDPIPYLTGAGNATPSGNPIGSLVSAAGAPASVRVQGWAFDYDRPSASIYIHVYIGGPAGSADAIGYDIGATTITNANINTQYNITGAHGFDKTISTTKRGTQEVYVYAINVDAGQNTLLGHKTVTIPTGTPVASYDGAVGGNGTVRVYGWAFDYDKPSTSIYIHMYIGGPAGSANAVGYDIGATNLTRSDVNAQFGITGKHGFDKTISTNVKGTVKVYLYAINVGNGTSKSMGSITVTIT